MRFSPVNASSRIAEKYMRYLKTVFQIDDVEYMTQFSAELADSNTYIAGPYLEISDSFEQSESLNNLIEQGVLTRSFARVNMPLDRKLYKHQVRTIHKALEGKSIVVSTGTGSGKTECFLVPILSLLSREFEAGNLNPGVRALIIYPMNALANDQMERLREILKDYPEITYGAYTGQTKEGHKEAVEEYRSLNKGALPLENELISREQMKLTPPNILLTNYAMLEFLMIRPEDNVFINGKYANNWKYIVLDEAHVYTGSTGIEVSMLLRRLKTSLAKKTLQFILTSATLGTENDNDKVVEFASNLCGEDFSIADIVRANRLAPKTYNRINRIPIGIYSELAMLLNNSSEEDVVISCIQKARNTSFMGKDLAECLYDLIVHDENYWRIREILQNPHPIHTIAKSMEWHEEQLVDFIDVASRAMLNDYRIFNAKYHFFLRATESVFITLAPSKKLFLTRKEWHNDENGERYKVFELAACSSCHASYLVGRINKESHSLVQSSFGTIDSDRSFFLLGKEPVDTDEDHLFDDEMLSTTDYELCPKCGFIRKRGSKPKCEHSLLEFVTITLVESKKENGIVTKCPNCESSNTNGILRQFFMGHEAVTSVIGTALFEELPSYELAKQEVLDDDSGFGYALSSGTQVLEKAKQFIAFSDSRQAAAYFATYFDQTYRNLLYKRLIARILESELFISNERTSKSLIEALSSEFEKHNITRRNSDIEKEAWKAFLREAIDNSVSTSLSSLGLLQFWADKKGIVCNERYGLSEDEVRTICSVFMLTIMSDAAITHHPMSRADIEWFTYGGIEYSYTLSDSNNARRMKSFIPTKDGMSNRRLDYLRRILEKRGFNNERKTLELLKNFWFHFFASSSENSLMVYQAGAYKLNCEKIIVSSRGKWYQCKLCGKLTPYYIDGVCPSYRCEGEIIPVDTGKVFSDNHYYRLAKELDIRELRVVEHTAQLDKETAYRYQKEFKLKEIDVLSCSTTFELGVDVGTLETIFMRNMPPSPANYAQRAGRAGRSSSSAAYSITFCNRGSHDFTFFNSPEKMIKGRIAPPSFNIENEKIAIRHVYASSLAMFWRRYPKYFTKTIDMFESENGNPEGFDVFSKYLQEKPEELKEYLLEFLPPSLIEAFAVKHFGWIDGMIGMSENELGVLTTAKKEYDYEVGTLKTAYSKAINEEQRSDYLLNRIRTYQKEYVLSYLSRKNVLPKYGFPVDTVELLIIGDTYGKSSGLQLQRDLSMAISEYAPQSQVVANGSLITSSYIRKIPNLSWRMYDYVTCPECQTLNIDVHTGVTSDSLHACHCCNKPFFESNKEVFLVPSYGFLADSDKIAIPSLRRPERTYRGEVSYVGYLNEAEKRIQNIHGSQIELQNSRQDELAVLNTSKFYVCETCGFTDLDTTCFTSIKKGKHKNPSGYICSKETLKKYSLGYRFETDVTQIKFLSPSLSDWAEAISVLHAVIRGTSSFLCIEQSEISGCIQYFQQEYSDNPNYSLILYDKTPGGAGHIRRLDNASDLEEILKETLQLLERCSCGGETGDSSCYSCLRDYYNQRVHDELNRGKAIKFLRKVLSIE
jgi:ATP-dependent helicase YprA (DUF1998 family)